MYIDHITNFKLFNPNALSSHAGLMADWKLGKNWEFRLTQVAEFLWFLLAGGRQQLFSAARGNKIRYVVAFHTVKRALLRKKCLLSTI